MKIKPEVIIFDKDTKIILHSKKDYEEVKKYYKNLPNNKDFTFEWIKEGKHGRKRYKGKNNK